MLRWIALLAVTAVACAAQPRVHGVLPANSHQRAALSPGMLISIYGEGLEPAPGCANPPAACPVAVTVGDVPLELLYISARQINARVTDIGRDGIRPLVVEVSGQKSAPVMVPCGMRTATISVKQPVHVGMPVWLEIQRAPGRDVYYPYRVEPLDFGGMEIELKFEGAPVTLRGPDRLRGTAGGLLNGTSAPAGSPRSRLPLHLAANLHRPGKYSVRFRGGEFQMKSTPGSNWVYIDESQWLDFEVLPLDKQKQDAWLAEMGRRLLAPANAGELLGDLLPSVMAAPQPWLVPVLAGLTNWSDPSGKYGHNERMVSEAAGLYLRELDTAWISAYANQEAAAGRPPYGLMGLGLLGPGLEETAIRKGLQSSQGWVHARALKAINEKSLVPALQAGYDSAILAAAERIMQANNPEAMLQLAYGLGRIRRDPARELLWLIANLRSYGWHQALASIAWQNNLSDLPRLGKELLKPDAHSSLAYALALHFDVPSHEHLRRAMRESPVPSVRMEAAFPLCRRRDQEALTTLADIAESQPNLRRQIAEFVRGEFYSARQIPDSELAPFLRNGAKPDSPR